MNDTTSINNKYKAMGITDSPVDPYADLPQNEKLKMRYENKFNLIMMNIFNHVVKFHDDDDINAAREQIDAVLMESPAGPICCFLKYVYLNDEYRGSLLDMNQEFFIEKTILDINQEVDNDRMIIERIFRFKKIWSSFKFDTKIFIMKSLRGLVLISSKYISLM